mgnify:CR=1 FL=1
MEFDSTCRSASRAWVSSCSRSSSSVEVRQKHEHLLIATGKLLRGPEYQLVTFVGIVVDKRFGTLAAGVVLQKLKLALTQDALAKLHWPLGFDEQLGAEPICK